MAKASSTRQDKRIEIDLQFIKEKNKFCILNILHETFGQLTDVLTKELDISVNHLGGEY